MIIFIFKRFPYFLLLLCFASYYPQAKKLEELSYEELEYKIDHTNNIELKKNYANLYLGKSKKEKKVEYLIYAYRYLSVLNNDLNYADSCIINAKKIKNKKFLAEALINKSSILNYNNHYDIAINYMFEAQKIAKEINDLYVFYETKYYIAQNKIFIGSFKEAKIELKECISFFKKNIKNKEIGKNYEMLYLYSLISLIDSNTKLKNQKDNIFLYKEAYSYLNNKGLKEYLPYFISCQGTDAYYQKNYNLAIFKLKKAINLYNDNWQHNTEIFYIGMSYWNLGNKEEAIKYFEKLDKEYYADKNQDPQFRSAYELLIEYYKSKNNTDKQLEYINKLMTLDRSYEKNYKYLFSKINKEYDSQKLIEEKNKIQNSLKLHQFLTVFIIISSIVIFIIIVYKYKSTKQQYKKTFKKIIAEKQNLENLKNIIVSNVNHFENAKPNDFYGKIPGLNPETLENILNQLDVFEKENQFLDSQISQQSLSEKLGTNASYFSKIIRVYKEKNYNQYINDLRIDYIVSLLQKDSKMLSKDIKELSVIAGFGNSESFSDHFKRKLKMTPTLFIKMMKEEMNNQS